MVCMISWMCVLVCVCVCVCVCLLCFSFYTWEEVDQYSMDLRGENSLGGTPPNSGSPKRVEMP